MVSALVGLVLIGDRRDVELLALALFLLVGLAVSLAFVAVIRALRRPILDLTVFDVLLGGVLVRWWNRRH